MWRSAVSLKGHFIHRYRRFPPRQMRLCIYSRVQKSTCATKTDRYVIDNQKNPKEFYWAAFIFLGTYSEHLLCVINLYNLIRTERSVLDCVLVIVMYDGVWWREFGVNPESWNKASRTECVRAESAQCRITVVSVHLLSLKLLIYWTSKSEHKWQATTYERQSHFKGPLCKIDGDLLAETEYSIHKYVVISV